MYTVVVGDAKRTDANTMLRILSGSMSIRTSRVVIHTRPKNVNPVTCKIELTAVGHTKSCH